MNPLKIEVTEAMRETATAAIYAHDLRHGIVDKTWANASAAIKAHYGEMATAALTAAFQHPEFVRQFLACVPTRAEPESEHDRDWCVGYNAAINDARASLGRLLGEEGK